MAFSATYLVLRKMLRKHLLVIRYSELVKILHRLEAQNVITFEEHKDLLGHGAHLKSYSGEREN